MPPCANGGCDATSQCSYTVAKEGVAKYGAGAYGRGGSLIDTNSEFTVKTEFVTKNSYADLWKVRTRLTQGSNTMEIDADCSDYISSMSKALEGDMALTFSTWRSAGRDASLANFEDAAQCPQPEATCDAATTTIKNIKVTSQGFDEEPEPKEIPTEDI